MRRRFLDENPFAVGVEQQAAVLQRIDDRRGHLVAVVATPATASSVSLKSSVANFASVSSKTLRPGQCDREQCNQHERKALSAKR